MQTHLDIAPKTASNVIKDTDELSFEQDVLAASMQKPVIVDFWAPWCMPCKQLMPVLEKAVNAAAGAVLMVKVNIDKNPGLAQALRVQSVPTVYAFFQGKPVDGFGGAKTESEITQFVSRLAALAGPAAPAADMKVEIKKIVAEADQKFQQGDNDAAMNAYGRALDIDPENAEALGGIAWCLLSAGDVEAVREMLTQLPPAALENSKLRGVAFIFSLTERAENKVDAAAQPKTMQNYFDLACAQLSSGMIEKGIDTLIAAIRKDREWSEKKSRTLLLEIFDALGPAHPLTYAGRRKLSAVLFS